MKTDHLVDDIYQIYLNQEEKLKAQYDRSLPFQDGFFDRFTRAKRLGFGEKTSIYNSAHVFGDVKVGNNTWVGPYVMLDGSGGMIQIGDYCSLSTGVHIYTHDSVEWSLSSGKKKATIGDVTIKSNVYIGAQCVIKHNTHIGSFCVVGANSFVNKDIPDYSIVAGSPAKKIGDVIIDNATGDITLKYFKKNEHLSYHETASNLNF